MTVNGFPQTAVDFALYTGQTSTGPTDYLWLYGAGDNQLDSTFTLSIPAGAVIVVTYTPYSSSNASQAQYGEALAPGPGIGTCGSGLYEGVLQVQNVSDIGTLNALAAAELARIGGIPKIITFETDEPGLLPGQLLHLDIALMDIANTDAMITAVTGTWIPPTLNLKGSFRYKIEARTNLDPGNTTNWWETLVQRTTNPLPINQQDTFTWNDNTIATPQIVSRTGVITKITWPAETPPISEDAVVTLYINGVAQVFTLAFPQTQPANTAVTLTLPKALQAQVFIGDILKVAITYVNVSGGPSPIAGYTINVLVSM